MTEFYKVFSLKEVKISTGIRHRKVYIEILVDIKEEISHE